MIKYGSLFLKEELLRCFNNAMKTGVFDESWHYTIFQMIPKTGDLSKISNWRPIAILPVLYKLFSRLIYNRIAPILLFYQSKDQHAFTPDTRIEDALRRNAVLAGHQDAQPDQQGEHELLLLAGHRQHGESS